MDISVVLELNKIMLLFMVHTLNSGCNLTIYLFIQNTFLWIKKEPQYCGSNITKNK